jgi:para-nitrobenzyl esterase
LDVRDAPAPAPAPAPGRARAAVDTDRMLACPRLAAARALARRAPAFAHEFADPNAPGAFPSFPGFPPVASHSGVLPFLLAWTAPSRLAP